MLDHVSVPVRDLDRAGKFYDEVFQPLGLQRLVTSERTIGYGKRYPEFWLNYRASQHGVGDSGAHVALRAQDTASVERFHAVAIAMGATDDGAPGERKAEMTGYFGAFIIDHDGNKIEAVTFPW